MEARLSEREIDEVRARQRDRERRRIVGGASVREGTVVEGVRNRGWAKAEATREKKILDVFDLRVGKRFHSQYRLCHHGFCS